MKRILILILTICSLTSFGQKFLENAPPQSPTVERINQAMAGAFTASGTDTYTVTFANGSYSYTALTNLGISVTFTNPNTGASTINFDGLGAKNVLKWSSGSLVAVAANDLIGTVKVRYDGTQFVMEGGTGSGGGTAQGIQDVIDTDNRITSNSKIRGDGSFKHFKIDSLGNFGINNWGYLDLSSNYYPIRLAARNGVDSAYFEMNYNESYLLNADATDSTKIRLTPTTLEVKIDNDDGATGEALMSDGAGGVMWATPAGGGSGTVSTGVANEIAYYPSNGTTVDGTTALPNGITATTQTAGDNSTKVATTAYVETAVSAGSEPYLIDANAAPYNCVPNDSTHDNSLGIEQAIQDAWDYANTHNNVAHVVFDNGQYFVTRALQTTSDAAVSGYYCQIPLPFNTWSTTTGYSTVVIRPKRDMRDYVPPIGMYFNNLNSGVTFRSTLRSQTYSGTYGWPAMFGGRDPKQGDAFPTYYSLIGIEFQNVTFVLPQSPTLAVINDALITRPSYKNIQAIIWKNHPADPTPEPYNPLGVFNIGPYYNNNALTYTGTNLFAGLYSGPSLTEHTIHSGQIAIADCYIGLRLAADPNRNAFFHGIQLSHVTTEGIIYGISASDQNGIAKTSGYNSDFGSSSGQITINFDFWDIETGSAGGVWNSNNLIFYVYDPGDILTGQIKYMRARANVGAIDYSSTTTRFSRLGARRVKFIDLSEPAPSVDPLSTFNDDFQRTASTSVVGNLASPANTSWTQQSGTWGIIDKKAYCSSCVSSGGVVANRLIAESGASDFTYRVVVARGATNNQVDVLYRYTDSNNMMIVELAASNLILYKKVSGTVTQIGSTYSVSTTVGTPYEIKIIASGSSHTVYLNGVSRITATESANSSNTIVGFGVISGTGASNNTDRFYSIELSTGTDPYDWNKLNKEFVNAKAISTNTIALSNALSVGTTPSAGTSGQVLTSAGTGAPPTWTTPTTGISKILNSSVTITGNVGAGEDVLYTYTVPAGQLASDKDQLISSVTGRIGASGNTKQFRLKFGASTIFDSGALSDVTGSYFNLEIQIYRTGAATQRCIVTWASDNSALDRKFTYTDTTETLSGTIVFQLTGEATATNEALFQMGDISYRAHE